MSTSRPLVQPRCRASLWPFIAVAIALSSIAWSTATFHPFGPEQPPTIFDNGRGVFSLAVNLALPWFLQWVSVTTIVLRCCRSRISTSTGVIVILVPLTLATSWFQNLLITARHMHWLLMASYTVEITQLQSPSNDFTSYERFLADFVGPILSPLHLRGPMALHGWYFFLSLFSTMILAGYLVVIGQLWQKARKANSVESYLFFTGVLLLGMSPSVLRLCIRMAQNQGWAIYI